MGLALVTTFAFCLWVIMWGLGVGGFDGMMVTLTIVVIAGTIVGLKRFLPSAQRKGGSSGGW